MCVSVKHDGRLIESIKDLASAIDIDRIIVRGGYGLGMLRRDLNMCLCPIDIEATAEAIGMRAARSDDDPMRWVLKAGPQVNGGGDV